MPRPADKREVSPRLRQASDYAWRLLLLGAAAYVVFLVALRFELIFIALFIALILTSLMRPPVHQLSKVLPRSLALVVTMLAGLGLIGGLFWLVGDSVANESGNLGAEFRENHFWGREHSPAAPHAVVPPPTGGQARRDSR